MQLPAFSFVCRMFAFLAACQTKFNPSLTSNEGSKSVNKPEIPTKIEEAQPSNSIIVKGVSLNYMDFIEKLDKSGRASEIEEITFENVRFFSIPTEPKRIYMPNLRKFTFGFDAWSKMGNNSLKESTIEFNNFTLTEESLHSILFFYNSRRNPMWNLKEIWRLRVDISIYAWRPCKFVDCVDKLLGISHGRREFYSSLNFSNVFDLNYVRRLSLKGEVIERVDLSRELRYLSLSEFRPQGVGFSWLQYFVKLNSIHLSHVSPPTEVMDLSVLNGMKYLRSISFYKMRISNSHAAKFKLENLGIGQGVEIPHAVDPDSGELQMNLGQIQADFFANLRAKRIGLFFKAPPFELISSMMANNYTKWIFTQYPSLPLVDEGPYATQWGYFEEFAGKFGIFPGDHFIMRRSGVDGRWIGRKIVNDLNCQLTNDFMGNPTFEKGIRETVEENRLKRAKIDVQNQNLQSLEIDGKFNQKAFPPKKVDPNTIGLLYFNGIEYEVEPFLNSLRQFVNLQYLFIENAVNFGTFAEFAAKNSKVHFPNIKLFSYHEAYGILPRENSRSSRELSEVDPNDPEEFVPVSAQSVQFGNSLTTLQNLQDAILFSKGKLYPMHVNDLWATGIDIKISFGNVKYLEMDHTTKIFTAFAPFCDKILNPANDVLELSLKSCNIRQHIIPTTVTSLTLDRVNFIEEEPGDKDIFFGWDDHPNIENFTCHKCLTNRYGIIRAPISAPYKLKGFEYVPPEDGELRINGILQLNSVVLGSYPNSLKNISRFIYAKRLSLLPPLEVDTDIINSVLQIPSLEYFSFNYNGFDLPVNSELNEVLYGSGVAKFPAKNQYHIYLSPNGVSLENVGGAWFGGREELNYEHKLHLSTPFPFSRSSHQVPRVYGLYGDIYKSLVSLTVSFVKLQHVSVDLDDVLSRISNRLSLLNA